MINDVLSGVPVSINAQIIMELLFGFKMDSYYRQVLGYLASLRVYADCCRRTVTFLYYLAG